MRKNAYFIRACPYTDHGQTVQIQNNQSQSVECLNDQDTNRPRHKTFNRVKTSNLKTSKVTKSLKILNVQRDNIFKVT